MPVLLRQMRASSKAEHFEMIRAAESAIACMQKLRLRGENVVSAVLDGRAYVEWEHYPPDDARDGTSGAQYYYHAHAEEDGRTPDFGHFHAFVHESSPRVEVPVQPDIAEASVSHLIGISMARDGLPTKLFTTNRWVTGERWLPAERLVALLPQFVVVGASGDYVSEWITSMVVLFRPVITDLLIERDSTLASRQRSHPDIDVFEDRRCAITSEREISLQDRIAAL